jgi:hypothetical protein
VAELVGVEAVVVVTVGVRAGEARIGVNGVNVNVEGKLPRALWVTSSLFCVCASVTGGAGWSENNCNREPERLSRSVGGTGIE